MKHILLVSTFLLLSFFGFSASADQADSTIRNGRLQWLGSQCFNVERGGYKRELRKPFECEQAAGFKIDWFDSQCVKMTPEGNRYEQLTTQTCVEKVGTRTELSGGTCLLLTTYGKQIGTRPAADCEQEVPGSYVDWAGNQCRLYTSYGSVIKSVDVSVCENKFGVVYDMYGDSCLKYTKYGSSLGEVPLKFCGVEEPTTQAPAVVSEPAKPTVAAPESVEQLPESSSTENQTSIISMTDDQLEIVRAMEEYSLVIYINKAASGPLSQHILVFENGQQVIETKVSTGREKWEAPPSGRKYFSATAAGFFTPAWLSEHYVSKLWKAPMPFAIFFNGGIAMHQVPRGAEDLLGRRASGGCVRIDRDHAKEIFKLVEKHGRGLVPQFGRNGKLVKSANGEVTRKILYKTLVIVDDSTNSTPELLQLIAGQAN